MNVSIVKSCDHHIVYIKEAYRDQNGIPRSRIIEKLGTLAL